MQGGVVGEVEKFQNRRGKITLKWVFSGY